MKEHLENLELGESMEFQNWKVTRVPGGWIWQDKEMKTAVFVPIPGL